MVSREYDVGMIGMGVMGANLVLNIADQGFSVVVYDAAVEKTREFIQKEVGNRKIKTAGTLREMLGLLSRPRAVFLLVPAGTPVDAVIGDLMPYCEPGDLLIDGGNSHFTDTNRREQALAEKGLLFMGMGVSGGEYGARHGPSLMPGGPREGYERVGPILQAIAARVKGDPCVTYLGSSSAGHYVKMVHNGIEYGLMQLISETYDLMKRGLRMDAEALAKVYAQWNETELNSFLLEITAHIFRQKDEKDPTSPLIDMIRDQTRQKGTGKWTSQEAMELMVPTPIIDTAVTMRNLSACLTERKAVAEVLHWTETPYKGDGERFVGQLKNALYVSMIMTYAQGMALLKEASVVYRYGLDLESVTGIWRGGCIIRAALLEDMRKAYRTRPDLPHLMVDQRLSLAIVSRQEDLRAVVRTAAELGLPAPGLMASLGYLDALRRVQLPGNLIQAQRDYFGAHTYERTDSPGVFHTLWS